MLAVAKLSSLLSRDPAQVLKLVEHTWQYLAGTVDYGLKFAVESDCQEMTIYTDSSFSDNCQGCVLVSWNGALLLWRSTRQSVVTVSTAESELVEVLEGACCGDATRVVIEEIRDQACRPVQRTDSSSALSIVVAESGSWRTRHLRKRAQALRTRVTSGDWVLRHMAGSTMPADIGTKVLATDRFQYLREELGMSRLPEEPIKKESGSCRPDSKEVVKTALKVLVIAAKVAQVKGEREDQGIMDESSPIQVYKVAFGENGLVKVRHVTSEEMGFWLMIAAVALFLVGVGVCIGMVMSGKESSVQIQLGESVRRPNFLEGAEIRRGSSSTNVNTQVSAPLPVGGTKRGRNGASSSAAAGRAAGAANGASSSAAAGRAAGAADAADGAAAGAAARRDDGAAAAGRAEGPAAGRAAGAADGAAAANDAPGERPNVQVGNLQRRDGIHARTFWVSEAGERFHNWRSCNGLRKARYVKEVKLCPICVDADAQLGGEMYTTASDDFLHSSWAHSMAFTYEPSRTVTPCKICMR